MTLEKLERGKKGHLTVTDERFHVHLQTSDGSKTKTGEKKEEKNEDRINNVIRRCLLLPCRPP